MERVITTNCFISDGKRLLLGMKKRGFGEGRWNGFGGKVAANESLEEAAARELFEECGIVPLDMELVGTMEFEYRGKDKIVEVNIFKVTSFEGDIVESEEMLPQWFTVTDLPYQHMWPDDTHWFPLFFANKKFKGTFLYEGYDTILEHSLEEVR